MDYWGLQNWGKSKELGIGISEFKRSGVGIGILSGGKVPGGGKADSEEELELVMLLPGAEGP